MRGHGIKASELLRRLQDMIRQHGDVEVWISAPDYPEGVSSITYRTAPDDGYLPTKVFVVR